MVDSNDQFELSTSLTEEPGDQRPQHGDAQQTATDEQPPASDAAHHPGEQPTEEPAPEPSSRQADDEDKNKTAMPVDHLGFSDLQNDDISEDENFKDDELDFEEVDNNSRGNEESLPKPAAKKKADEDGEVNSEEELEDGEVKEEDSDDELGRLNDGGHYAHGSSSKQSPANLNALCRFYSKGLCTWGNSCRFVHDKPMGNCCSCFSHSLCSVCPCASSLSKPIFRFLVQVRPPPTVRTN